MKPIPAGSMSVSAGRYDEVHDCAPAERRVQGAQILKPETAQLMHSRTFGLVPEFNGMAMAFTRRHATATASSGMAATRSGSISDMHLMPDQNLGFFISYNSAGKGEGSPRTILWQNFLDRYFPYTPPAGQAVAHATSGRKAAVAGTYWSSRRSDTTVMFRRLHAK